MDAAVIVIITCFTLALFYVIYKLYKGTQTTAYEDNNSLLNNLLKFNQSESEGKEYSLI